jgi:hypothetical protein
VQKTMLGPEVLDSEAHQEIVFKPTAAEPAGQGRCADGRGRSRCKSPSKAAGTPAKPR